MIVYNVYESTHKTVQNLNENEIETKINRIKKCPHKILRATSFEYFHYSVLFVIFNFVRIKALANSMLSYSKDVLPKEWENTIARIRKAE